MHKIDLHRLTRRSRPPTRLNSRSGGTDNGQAPKGSAEGMASPPSGQADGMSPVRYTAYTFKRNLS